MRKNLITCFSILAFFFLTLTPVSAKFTDVSEYHKNYDAISFLGEIGVIGGYGDGSFKPNVQINRAELMKILIEAKGISLDATRYSDCFSDVNTQWFAKYICYGKEKGWVQGYEDGSFHPNQSVNKAEALKMIINIQGLTSTSASNQTTKYTAIDKSAWYFKYVQSAEAKNILEDENFFDAGANILRSEVAESIYRSIVVKTLTLEKFSIPSTADKENIKGVFNKNTVPSQQVLIPSKQNSSEMTKEQIWKNDETMFDIIKYMNQFIESNNKEIRDFTEMSDIMKQVLVMPKYANESNLQQVVQNLINEIENTKTIIGNKNLFFQDVLNEATSLIGTGKPLVGEYSNFLTNTRYQLNESQYNDSKNKVVSLIDQFVLIKENILTQKLAEMDAKVLAIKEKYYADVENIKNQPVSMNTINGRINKLTDDVNAEIDKLWIEREKIIAEYSN